MPFQWLKIFFSFLPADFSFSVFDCWCVSVSVSVSVSLIIFFHFQFTCIPFEDGNVCELVIVDKNAAGKSTHIEHIIHTLLSIHIFNVNFYFIGSKCSALN